MADPLFLNEEQVTEHRSTVWARSAEDDKRLPVSWCRDEHCWLHNRAEELERQLRLRTVALVAALALSAFLGSLIVSSFYKSQRPKVAIEPAPPLDTPGSSPSMTRTVEQPLQFERSPAWALGEERIEEIAALHFEAQRTQATAEQLTMKWRDAGGPEAATLEVSAEREIRGEGSEAVARDCSLETIVSPPSNHDSNRAAQRIDRLHYAATDFVNLRAAPSNTAEVLTVVAQGELVRRTGRDLGWLQVDYGDRSASTIRGWVYSSNLRYLETAVEPTRP